VVVWKSLALLSVVEDVESAIGEELDVTVSTYVELQSKSDPD